MTNKNTRQVIQWTGTSFFIVCVFLIDLVGMYWYCGEYTYKCPLAITGIVIVLYSIVSIVFNCILIIFCPTSKEMTQLAYDNMDEYGKTIYIK